MELLKDSYDGIVSDDSQTSNVKIKEEIQTSNEYNDLPGNYFPEEAPTRWKDASEERQFTVTLADSGRKHAVRGRFCDNVLTALKATRYVCDWMNKKEEGEFYLIEKKESFNICINLGMPLKYVSEGSQFEMKFYKLKKNENNKELCYRQYDDRKEECILFYISGNGSRMETCGAQSRRLIRHSKVLKEYCRFCIFAPKGESIRDALCNDGRFLPLLKEKNWRLVKEGVTLDNSFSVSNRLSEEFFEIEVESERRGPNEKQNCLASHEDQLNSLKKLPPYSEQGQLHTVKKPPPLPYSEQGQLHTLEKQQQHFDQYLLDLYPKLKEQKRIIEQFLGVRQPQLKKKDVLEVYKRNFGKEINNSLSIQTMRTLVSYSGSVGYIKWDKGISSGCATCFVLSGGYILTCHHVVKMIVGEGIEEKDWGSKIKQSAHVTFSYEENHCGKVSWFSFENWFEISDKDLDFAILKLEENGSKSHPPGLLHLHFPSPQNGLIFIVGHPNGEIKSVDGCLVVSVFERSHECTNNLRQRQEAECSNSLCGYSSERNCIHLYNPNNFEGVINNPNIVTYNTCFFEGSSGSPIFNKQGQLVALHAAGFSYKMKNKENSVIEYGSSIHSILSTIELKFKPWYDDIIAPVLLTRPGAKKDSSHVDTSLNDAEEKMDTT